MDCFVVVVEGMAIAHPISSSAIDRTFLAVALLSSTSILFDCLSA
jgi:hypothetical protein